MNNHAPIKIKPKTNATLIGKPWITHAIRKSFKTKNRLYKQFYREKDQLKKERIFEYFKSYRNHLVTIIRMSKKDYFKKYFDDNKKDTESLLYNQIHSKCKINKTNRYQPIKLN